jgi:acyl carrier protein
VTDGQILSRLTDIFREVFDRPNLTLTPTTTADQVVGWDSLMNVRLFVATEMGFGVRFNTSEITSLKMVGDLISLIKAKGKR